MTPDGLYEIARRVWDVHHRGRSDWRGLDREDAIQAAVTRAWQVRDKYDSRRAKEATFFTQVMLNEISQFAKVARNKPAAMLVPDPDSVYAAVQRHPDALDYQDEADEIAAILLTMPDGIPRQCAEMRLAGLTPREVAAHLGLTMHQVAGYLRAARALLRIPC